MSPEEIQELMTLRDWSMEKLADELELSGAAVYKWLSKRGPCSGPAAILMRLWLTEAREAKKNSKANGRKVGAR